jgi:hypothetical protein
MSSQVGRRITYAAMASAALLIVGAAGSTLIDNSDAGESTTPTAATTPTTNTTPTPDPDVSGEPGTGPSLPLYGAALARKPQEG